MTNAAEETLPAKLEPLSLATSEDTAKANAALTGDFNPIHLDLAFAQATPFGAPIIHGTMALNLLIKAVERTLGAGWTIADVDIRFARPVPVGATITALGDLVDGARGLYEVAVDTGDAKRALSGTLAVRLRQGAHERGDLREDRP